MTLPPLGIDISKRKFDACLVRDGGKLRHHVFPNSPAGFAQLSAWLAKHHVGHAHACLEATGAYGEALATYLHDAGHTVSVVNPAQIKAYAQSRLSRAKTDKADATLIARFCAERRPPRWSPLPREVRELQALARRLDALLEMRGMEANRREVAGTQAVKESLSEHLAFLDREITRTEGLIRPHIDSHPGLRAQRELLVSIPGVGETTAAKLLFPAVVAIRHNPYVKDLSERLRAERREGVGYAGGDWADFALEGVELTEVPGDHFTMVRPPHVETLAESLARCVEDATACVFGD